MVCGRVGVAVEEETPKRRGNSFNFTLSAQYINSHSMVANFSTALRHHSGYHSQSVVHSNGILHIVSI